MAKCKIKKGFFVLRESDELCPPGASFSMSSYYCDQCPYRNLDGEEEDETEELE
jgi:C4-type Zn-finger protein